MCPHLHGSHRNARTHTRALLPQVLYHTPARFEPTWHGIHNSYVLRHEQLPFWMDSDWDLGAGTPATQLHSSAAAGAAGAAGANDSAALISTQLLHWVVFIPPARFTPLAILQADGTPSPTNSMWLPSWGGVVILNPDEHSSSTGSNGGTGAAEQQPSLQPLGDHSLSKVAGVVVSQLHALLGLPAELRYLGSSAQAAAGGSSGSAVVHLPARTTGFADWQLDALMRQRTVADLSLAAKTLGSLSNIVQQLPNLEMPDLIGQQVQQAMAALGTAISLVEAGQYEGASWAAAQARSNAEAAFLHPAVLAQNNFPDSHKLGIYMPLFLPVSVPLLQGLVLELVRLLRARGLLPTRRSAASS